VLEALAWADGRTGFRHGKDSHRFKATE